MVRKSESAAKVTRWPLKNPFFSMGDVGAVLASALLPHQAAEGGGKHRPYNEGD
jgi:hypothetical protein